MACGCGCARIEIGKVCDNLPKCIKFIDIFVGLARAGQTINVNFVRERSNKQVCRKATLLVDSLGFVKVNVNLSLDLDGKNVGFLFNAYTMPYKYKIFLTDLNKVSIKIPYKGVDYCSLSFYVGGCENQTDNYLINP